MRCSTNSVSQGHCAMPADGLDAPAEIAVAATAAAAAEAAVAVAGTPKPASRSVPAANKASPASGSSMQPYPSYQPPVRQPLQPTSPWSRPQQSLRVAAGPRHLSPVVKVSANRRKSKELDREAPENVQPEFEEDQPAVPLPSTGALRQPRPAQGVCRLVTGAYTVWGEKPSWPKQWVSQDAHLVTALPGDRLLVAVFDGHGEQGHHIAAQVKRVFEQQAVGIADDPAGPVSGFHRVFTMCQGMLAQQEELCRLSGTTATVALIDMAQQKVTTAHVGDSTVVITRNGLVVFATQDHKLDAEAERRIVAHGGVVRAVTVRGGDGGVVRRVFAKNRSFPGLAMARALGDLEANRLGVLAEPEVITGLSFTSQDSLLVASDGLWDMLPREVVAAGIVSQTADPDAVARSLVLDARSCYPPGADVDDITAVLVQTDCNGGGVAPSAISAPPGMVHGPEAHRPPPPCRGPGNCGFIEI